MKIIALDLDGTLLNVQKELTDRTRRALKQAADQGNWIVPATGRALQAIPTEILSLPFVRYVISINGASVSDETTGERLYRADIPKETALALMDFAKRYDCMYDCYWQDTGWSNRRFLERVRYYNHFDEEVVKLILRSRQPVEDLEAIIRSEADAVQKVQLCFRNLDEREQARTALKSAFPDIAATSSFQNNLELNWKTADKGRGLMVLAEHLGVSRADTVAFGDSSNDLSMLRAAGVGVAMGNASDEVKAACDAVTAPNTEDGVAQYIEQHVLN